ncbi:LysR family transcriptional regulator [Microbacterium sp. A196]|uniref:LysR family transcriptional regulator n=1 Tax=Microbacterium sp. A196 TaxID=3457320 RepID=UPI003FD53591
MIDQRRLEVLRAFSSLGTMAAAADALFMSASAVSQQIRLLEGEVGVALTERRGRRAVLTPAGLALVGFADEMAGVSEAAVATMRRFSGTYRGEVHISAFPSSASAILPTAIANLRAQHPELNVLVSDLEPFESVRALRDGVVDLALIDDLNPFQLGDLDVREIGRDELVMCTPDRGDFAEGPIEVGELRDARWLLDGSQEVFDAYLHELCDESGFTPDIVARCRNVSVTLALVEAGIGVALLSRMHLRREAFAIRTSSLAPARFRTVRVARRRSSQPSHLIDAVQSAVISAAGTTFARHDREAQLN